LCAGHFPFPSVTRCMNSPCVCSSIITTCHLNSSHYQERRSPVPTAN
jgi:hypothetical protein